MVSEHPLLFHNSGNEMFANLYPPPPLRQNPKYATHEGRVRTVFWLVRVAEGWRGEGKGNYIILPRRRRRQYRARQDLLYDTLCYVTCDAHNTGIIIFTRTRSRYYYYDYVLRTSSIIITRWIIFYYRRRRRFEQKRFPPRIVLFCTESDRRRRVMSVPPSTLLCMVALRAVVHIVRACASINHTKRKGREKNMACAAG